MMPWCDNCGKKSPAELHEVLADYVGEYFCGEECRATKRAHEEKLGGF